MEKEIKFEESIARLEEIVNALENNNTGLDESLKLFQEGIELVRLCEAKLKDIEDKAVKIVSSEE